MLLFLSFVAFVSSASFSERLNFWGQYKVNNVWVTGDYNFEFRIVDSNSGTGNVLFDELHRPLTVNKSVWQVRLGDFNSLSGLVFDKNYFLETYVNNVFQSRVPLDMVATANRSKYFDANGLTGQLLYSSFPLDFNLQYSTQLDANRIFNKVSDSNNVGRLSYLVIANPPWITSAGSQDRNLGVGKAIAGANMTINCTGTDGNGFCTFISAGGSSYVFTIADFDSNFQFAFDRNLSTIFGMLDQNRGRIDTNVNTWRKTDTNSIVSKIIAGSNITVSCSGSDSNGACQITGSAGGSSQPYVVPWLDVNVSLANLKDKNIPDFNFYVLSLWNKYYDLNWLADWNAVIVEWSKISNKPYLLALSDVDGNIRPSIDANRLAAIQQSMANINLTIDKNAWFAVFTQFTNDSNFVRTGIFNEQAWKDRNFASSYYAVFKKDWDGNALAWKTSILDGNYVDLFNTQTINGLKTFNNNVNLANNADSNSQDTNASRSVRVGTGTNGMWFNADTNTMQFGMGVAGTNFCFTRVNDTNFSEGFC